ncbi:homogentisate 1,2-dioxygenase [Nocardia harenae]|uniref:homogentisate 1,2-dioxygenase n=1 Tax=Nocardia harenae TaxID=358707 RepID=UPI0008327C98|nr:homogentisate 1,2-dioxygenase [Nocardia harenae]
MAYYRTVGRIPPKRHTQFRQDSGELYSEELAGADGFSGDSSLLYHRGTPAAITAAEPWQPGDLSLAPNAPLLPRHLRLHDLFRTATADIVTGRRLVLGNADVRISYAVASEPSELYRNATGDECVYIERGSGVLETVFGALDFRTGDYVLVPRATIHRWLPAEGTTVRAYIIEATGHIAPPGRYLSRFGQFLEHAPYCERDLHGPTAPLLREGTDVRLLVKHRGVDGITGTRYLLPAHPFDVVGWDGCLYPYTVNIEDFEPITGRIHQPPPVHQVFAGHNFVICNFVPRKVDYHPLAVPVPYHHSNVDSDEVMFYCGGDYEARRGSGIGLGSISLHPGGHTHGPQPGAAERSLGTERFAETAVMVDTFAPLGLGAGGLACEDPEYAWSWA